jgi:hypothetical protein
MPWVAEADDKVVLPQQPGWCSKHSQGSVQPDPPGNVPGALGGRLLC